MLKKAYIDIEEGQIHYRYCGDDESKPPLILLHQTASSSWMYERIGERLLNEYKVIAPDTPGFGQSFSPAEHPTVNYYAQTMFEALDCLGIRNFFLFGHHTGASIAAEMAAIQPDRVIKLILSGPPALTAEERQDWLINYIKPLKLQETGGHLQQIWERIRNLDAEASLELSHREAVLNLTAGTRYTEAYVAVFKHDFINCLKKVCCPTLVMAGEKDSLFSYLTRAHELLHHGEIRKLPDASTYICDQKPDVVSKIMRTFFSDK